MTTGTDSSLHDRILVVTIDHPPVNAVATPVRRHVHASLQRAAADPRVRGVVIVGSARLFSAGADLREFADGTAMDSPTLHGDILPSIASMTKPVVAAVGGAALGGGFELALGCHDRVFAAGSRVGLPETTLGLMPGAGGTQWLPRAVGLERAADLIASGRVEPIEAFAGTPLAHAIVPADRLLSAAMARVNELADQAAPRTIDDRPIVDAVGEAKVRALAADLAARPGTLPGVLRALDAVALTTSASVDDGMRAEYAMFEPLLAAPEARALRHVFLAERRRKADADVSRSEHGFAERVAMRIAAERATLIHDGVDDDAVTHVLAGWRSGVGFRGRPPSEAAVADRLLAAIVDEGRLALDAGDAVAGLAPADLDLALVRTGHFARVTGGPFFLAGRSSPLSGAIDRTADRP